MFLHAALSLLFSTRGPAVVCWFLFRMGDSALVFPLHPQTALPNPAALRRRAYHHDPETRPLFSEQPNVNRLVPEAVQLAPFAHFGGRNPGECHFGYSLFTRTTGRQPQVRQVTVAVTSTLAHSMGRNHRSLRDHRGYRSGSRWAY